MKRKTYNIFAFIIDVFKYVPCQAAATAGYTVILSLLPAFQTLAMAAFVDSVALIFKGEKAYESIYLYFALRSA